MSVNSKNIKQKQVARINWKGICFWTLNIISYILAFIFLITVIVGSVSSKKTTNNKVNNDVYENDVVLPCEPQRNNAFIDDDSNVIYFYNYDANIPYHFDFSVLDADVFSNYEIDVAIVRNGVASDYIATGDEINDEEGYVSFVGGLNDVDCYVTFYDLYNPGAVKHICVAVELTIFDTTYFDFSFEIGITYSHAQDFYDVVYTAVEAYQYGNPNTDIFDDIGDSVVGFIDTINSGLDSAIDVFYDDGLTTLGYLSVIVVAVALGYFGLRFIMGLIRLRG